MSTTFTPLATAASSAGITAGLVGVMAMPFTPWVTIDSMRLISPWSSVAEWPIPIVTLAPGVEASHFCAADFIAR